MKKPFNIEAAKSGAKVVTRDGRSVEILKYDYVENGKQKVVFCCADEKGNHLAYGVNPDGLCYEGKEDKADLFIEVEPTYRPYANAAEMDEAIKKHGTLVKNSLGRRLAITGYDDEGVSVGVGQPVRYGTMLKSYTWIDNTPCGILEGGEE